MVKNDHRTTAIYCRVAKVDKFAIELQEESMIAFAKKQGYSNLVSYIDNGFSGLNFDRPAFSNLVSDIETGKVKTVITHSVERIGRNLIETGKWLEWLNHQGIDFATKDVMPCDYPIFAVLYARLESIKYL